MSVDRLLRLSAWSFAGAAIFGSAISVVHDVPGEPLRIRLPISTRTGILAGWGAGVAAPWPMPALGLLVTSVPRFGPVRGRVCIGLGLLCIAGTVVEPVTLGRRQRNRAIVAAIAANVASSLAMVGAGLVNGRKRSRAEVRDVFGIPPPQ